MEVQCNIDEPADRCIRTPTCRFRGWIAITPHSGGQELKFLHFKIGQLNVPHVLTSRPDVEGAFPNHASSGFQIRFDLTYYMQYVVNDHLAIYAMLPQFEPFRLDFTIDKGVVGLCLAAAAGA